MDQQKDNFRQILKGAFAVFSLALLFYAANGLYQQLVGPGLTQNRVSGETKREVLGMEVKGMEPQKIVRAVPVRLQIPGINVDALVEHVGITSEGEMDVPGDTSEAGWYQLGPSPGEQGSAVITGHLNTKTGGAGVFNNLGKLKAGDEILLTNDLGKIITFVVRESRTYQPGYAEEVFSSSDSGSHLNLITCDGAWDEAKGSYSKRLVVFADIK